MTACKNSWHCWPHPRVPRCPECKGKSSPFKTQAAVGPYRSPGEIEVPRPIEIQFKVCVFLLGGNKPDMDSANKLAQDFERKLEEAFGVGSGGAETFADRSWLAVEVTPIPAPVPLTGVAEHV